MNTSHCRIPTPPLLTICLITVCDIVGEILTITFLPDETCFVALGRVYECGSNVMSETVCEDMGCCFNSSATIPCYYPSGMSSIRSSGLGISVQSPFFYLVKTSLYLLAPQKM